MPVRFLSDAELARLSSWPDEIAVEDAVTFFTLSADDLAWLAGFNRPRTGSAPPSKLSTLPWLGWIPDDLAGCPAAALDRLAHGVGYARMRRRHCWRPTAAGRAEPAGNTAHGCWLGWVGGVCRRRTQAARRVPAGPGARTRRARRAAAAGL